jgi:hypothetical protein
MNLGGAKNDPSCGDDNIFNVGLCATLIKRGNSEANSSMLSF